MNKSNKKFITKLGSVICAFLFVILFMGTFIAWESASAINAFLGIETSSSVGEGQIYFKRSFDSVEALMAENRVTCEQAEAEGAVLLKNENEALPLLKGSRKVSLFGITSASPVYGGLGSAKIDTSSAPTFKQSMEEAGFEVNSKVWDFYTNEAKGYSRSAALVGEVAWSKMPEDTVNSISSYGDAAIFVMGRVAGEGNDLRREGVADGAEGGDYLELSPNEESILQGLNSLKKAGKVKKIIVLFNAANALEVEFLRRADLGIDAAMWIGSVGQVGLNAVADLLAGTITPSGKLSDTYYVENDLNPVAANFGVFTYNGNTQTNTKYKSYVVYQEGIYVGYRYAETRYEDVVMGTDRVGTFDYHNTIAYPFGYGKSYTDFEYSDYSVVKNEASADKETTYTVSLKVKNVGNTYSGKESVQIYVQKPYTEYDKATGIEKSSVDLVGYAKTQILAPGAEEVLTIEVAERDFASYDSYGNKTYIIESGKYYLAAGKNAHDAVNNILAAKGYAEGLIDVDGNAVEGDIDLVADINVDINILTYSKSAQTGNEITNHLSNADVNLYRDKDNKSIGSVKYITRQDWVGTVHYVTEPNSYEKLNWTEGLYYDMTYHEIEETRTDWPTYGADNGLMLVDLIGKDYDDPLWDKLLDQLSWNETALQCVDANHLTHEIVSIGKPHTFDENGPSGMSKSFVKLGAEYRDVVGMCYPCNGIIAATFNTELAEKIGEQIGEDGLTAGFAGLYGLGSNTHRSPYEGRVFEYYSEDGFLGGTICGYETKGIQSKGMYCYNKHFAFNEQEENRAGIGTWFNEQAGREIYLRMFADTIRVGNGHNVMTSYNRVGATYSGAHKGLVTDILRGEFGMDGFAITDMGGDGVEAKPFQILAGNDTFDGNGKVADIGDYRPGGAKESPTLAWAMRESVKRICYIVANSHAMNGLGGTIVQITPWWQTALIVMDIVSGVAFVAFATLLTLQYLPRKKAR